MSILKGDGGGRRISRLPRIFWFGVMAEDGGQRADMKIIHLGGENTVTGSCHLLQVHGLNILVDCGMAQGDDFVEPMERWPVAPVDVDYLFLTHAHIDHIGRVPELIRRGFRGEIITTHPTKALLTPMLEDALGFQDLSRKEAACAAAEEL